MIKIRGKEEDFQFKQFFKLLLLLKGPIFLEPRKWVWRGEFWALLGDLIF